MPKAPSSQSRGQGKPRRGQRKAPGLTCQTCRKRKIRCDGGQPACGICVAYRDQCHYDKPPPMTQIAAMAERIAELERRNEELSSGKRLSLPREDEPASNSHIVGKSVAGDSVQQATADHVTLEKPIDTSAQYYDTTSSVLPPRSLLGSTDALHTPHQMTHIAAVGQASAAFWEAQAVENAAMFLQLPTDTVQHLLDTHWTWVHPTFMFVPRAVFLRDAAVGGPYFSLFLLVVICLHSTRFTEHSLGEHLLARTKMMLGHEMHKEPSIPFTQALLQLSAREFGKGSTSMAWTYSGMAFRMAIDLGVLSNARSTSSDSEDERRVQIRTQLAWSCYLWDKVLSLYLGRMPSFFEAPAWEPSFSGVEVEDDLWPPTSAGAAHDQLSSHTVACFRNFCKLAIVINDILVNVYGQTKRKTDMSSFVRTTQQTLEQWRVETPRELLFDPAAQQRCPPPNITVQNMLFHTTVILLHRPFRASAECQNACRDAARQIEMQLLLFERTYGLSKGTYVMAYCTYTAATVAVQDTIAGLQGARKGLDTFVRALNSIRESCPCIQRSIDIISKCINAPVGKDRPRDETAWTASREMHQGAEAESILLEQMPAFPYCDPPPFLSGEETAADAFSNSVSLLNSYPDDWFKDVLDKL